MESLDLALTVAATIVYVAVIILAAFDKLEVTYNGMRVKTPLGRVFFAVLSFPFIGVVLWLLGFVGSFLLLPFKAAFDLMF